MRNAALGDDDGEVVPYYKGVPVKSMGHEFTLSSDIDSRERIAAHLLRLSDQVARRMRQDGYLGRIVSVKLRDSKFKTTIRQRALPHLMSDENLIYPDRFRLGGRELGREAGSVDRGLGFGACGVGARGAAEPLRRRRAQA